MRVLRPAQQRTKIDAESELESPVIALSSFYRYAMAEDVTHINAVQTVTRPRVDTDHSSMQVEVLAAYAVVQLRPTTRR